MGYIVIHHKEEQSEKSIDVWSLVHPTILEITKPRVDQGFYADAVEAACKALNAQVRDIVRSKTGEELDGSRLMLKALSVDNPIIRLSNESTQSAQDTQKGYMQIFSGVMTGIRNPKAHDNEIITKEDALRKIVMISILMFKLDARVDPV